MFVFFHVNLTFDIWIFFQIRPLKAQIKFERSKQQRTMPIFKVFEWLHLFNPASVFQICAVCLEEFKQKDELGICPCKHAFHRKWVWGCVDIHCPTHTQTSKHNDTQISADFLHKRHIFICPHLVLSMDQPWADVQLIAKLMYSWSVRIPWAKFISPSPLSRPVSTELFISARHLPWPSSSVAAWVETFHRILHIYTQLLVCTSRSVQSHTESKCHLKYLLPDQSEAHLEGNKGHFCG